MPKIFKLFSKNKKTLFFAIGLGLVLFFLSWNFIEADLMVTGPDGEDYLLCIDCGPWPHEWPNCLLCFVRYMVSLPIRMIFAVIVGIFGLGALIAGVFYAIVAVIVTWLIGVIMSVGIVPGADNTPEIVRIGWNFSRQFANLFFILALACIGLATILRIKEYEAKKALPTLIIIALLINFTPVIVGFVVDMGNIVTKFFLDSAGPIRGMLDIMQTAVDYLVTSMAHLFLRDGDFWADFLEIMGEFIGIVIYGAVLFIFFNVAVSIYLVIGMIFFFRTVILWILMILSPIAFLSKVFPDTKTTKMVFPGILHWDQWWEKLIQWTVIGIPIAFFLYLSNLIMANESSIQSIFSSGELEQGLTEMHDAYAVAAVLPGFQDQFVSLFSSLLAPTVALVLLGMGVLISIQAVPEGARGVLEIAKTKGAKWGRSWAGRVARGVRGAPTDIKRVRDVYLTARTQGRLTRRQALREAAGAYWATRAQPAIASVAKGSWSAIKDTSAEVTREILKVPEQKKKERATCNKCGNFVPQDSKNCPHCGNRMPVCPNPKCRTIAVPGAAFCRKCGTRI